MGEDLNLKGKEGEPVSIRREELESLLRKPRARPQELKALGWAIACSLVILSFLMLIAFIPQHLIDSLVYRLQASSALQLQPLELVSLKESWGGNVFSIEGVVRNGYSEDIHDVEAVIRIYNEGGLMDTIFAPLSEKILRPGAQSSFRVSYVYDGQLKHYELFFRQKDGPFIAHKDVRKISSTSSYVEKKQPL